MARPYFPARKLQDRRLAVGEAVASSTSPANRRGRSSGSDGRHGESFGLYSPPGVDDAAHMKTAEPARLEAVGPLPPPSTAQPLPFAPTPEELPAAGWDAPIEPPPPAARRQVKGRIRHCAASQPIAIADPWQ